MKICIVDDEKPCIEQLYSILLKYSKETSTDISFELYNNGEDFKKSYSPEKYDIVFLDIYIGETTGMELAGFIRERSEKGMIIFCTTSLTDMPQAFRYHAFEYIIKPAEYDRVKAVMDDAISVLPGLEKYIDIQSGKDKFRFALSSILSVTTSGHYLDITTKDGEVSTIRMTLTDFSGLVENDDRFLLVNKGIIVNMDHISTIADRTCIMSDGATYPIKVREAASIKRHWQDYRIEQVRKGQVSNV